MDSEAHESPASTKESGFEESLDTLKLSAPDRVLEPATPEPNPWQTTSEPEPDTSIHAEPIAAYDVPTASGFATPIRPDDDHRKADAVLHEFDPLASEEERGAREAWSHSEGHPMPPPPKSPPAVLDLPTPEEPPAASSIIPTSPFPSLTALARTFALPLTRTGRERPRSLDTAASVPSPATLSSFAARQRLHPSLPASPTISASNSADGSPDPSRDGSPLPAGTRVRRDKDKDKESEFDFQKFLDQMKLKAAEPVAKYLRSCVCSTFLRCQAISYVYTQVPKQLREADVHR
jgi:Rab5 GDP/GTP exchange factor